ncbi:MAG: alanine--tRNA ligase [Phycisphaerae bacterium]|nr:alanine--tRNA ligase [Phycisphaerae bacterium]
MQRTSARIRQDFIDFFVSRHGHAFVPSAPVIPHNDPTLMFTNAGMNQFKDVFLGTGTRPYVRAANTQKCIRAGGKHNDLDDVGKDTYHHTFFEMLGNWSFGDYFKKEAIAWAWELLTREWNLDKSRLHATVFEGDAAEGLDPDDEAAELWRTVTDIDPTHIHRGRKKDNFWEMGDTGPCGPCSEIHIDLTPDRSGGTLVNAGDARVIEIWNLVFIQFNRSSDGRLTPLPAKHVDTGMGFERVTALLQGKRSNYDTDIFAPLFGVIQRTTNAAAYRGTLPTPGQAQHDRHVLIDIAYRVIADHLRCLTFALTDGALPGNEGRGYVLRRILRRAFRYGWQYLGMHEPFLHRLVPAVVDLMDEAFPELRSQTRHVAEVIRDEEESFGRTLERGIALFEDAAQYAVRHHHGRIKGEDAFRLHDTYGFPIDLTQIMAEEKNLSVDVAEYERLMEQARERARAATSGSQDILPAMAFPAWTATDDSAKYSHLQMKSTISGWVQDGRFSDHGPVPHGGRLGLLCRQSCFYAEQGGQVGDRGEIIGPNGSFVVEDTQRRGDAVVHVGVVTRGSISVGETVSLKLSDLRRPTVMNHTSTHLLNWALREVLGDHVQQKGSLVDADKTRFDFSHTAAVTDEQLRRVEGLVNDRIRDNLAVYARDVPQKDALKICGLRAVFGEKYPDVVRVVSIGPTIEELLADPANRKWWQFSIEFCGGTHLARTSEAGSFCLVEESAVARGIRRVVGVTGDAAAEARRAAIELSRRLDESAKLDGPALLAAMDAISETLAHAALPVIEKSRLRDRAAELQDRVRVAQKQQARQDTAGVLDRAARLLDGALRIGSTAIITGDMGTASVEQLRPAIDSLRARASSAAVLLAAENEGKVVLLAAMTADVVARGVKAGDLIREIAPIVGGRGGGKPDIAQGGGPDLARAPEALQAATKWLRDRLT